MLKIVWAVLAFVKVFFRAHPQNHLQSKSIHKINCNPLFERELALLVTLKGESAVIGTIVSGAFKMALLNLYITLHLLILDYKFTAIGNEWKGMYLFPEVGKPELGFSNHEFIQLWARTSARTGNVSFPGSRATVTGFSQPWFHTVMDI